MDLIIDKKIMKYFNTLSWKDIYLELSTSEEQKSDFLLNGPGYATWEILNNSTSISSGDLKVFLYGLARAFTPIWELKNIQFDTNDRVDIVNRIYELLTR